MKRMYVFRLDGAKGNDAYFERRTCAGQSGSVLGYQGMSMSIGAKWRPDLVEVEVSEDGRAAFITLVELEANAAAAMVSCRKYVPEPSAEIVRQFLKYLAAVEKLCKRIADPRLADIRALTALLGQDVRLVVRTAGALRSANAYCEIHALHDQPDPTHKTGKTDTWIEQTFAFTGVRVLTRREIDGLRRAVRMLHAAIQGEIHLTGALRTWHSMPLSCRPLDAAMMRNPDRFPVVNGLLARYTVTRKSVNCDELADELAELWTGIGPQNWTRARAAQLVGAFLNTAIGFSNDDSMQTILAAACRAVEASACPQDEQGKRAA